MTQGIRVVKDGFDISTRDPRNVALDTTQIGSLKKLPTLHIPLDPKYFTERYDVVAGPGFTATFGRIRIPHDFGYPPAFQGFFMDNSGDYKYASTLPYLGLSFGSALTIESNETEVIISGIPNAGYNGSLAVNIFAENLEARTI